VESPTWSVKRTFQPTASPSGVPSSSETRSATVRGGDSARLGVADQAAHPRGPAPGQIFGIWVVLPEPVSPATITNLVVGGPPPGLSSFFWLTGSCSGYVTAGTAARAGGQPQFGLVEVRGDLGEYRVARLGLADAAGRRRAGGRGAARRAG